MRGKKWTDACLALGACLVIALAPCLRFGLRYDLNDDILIKDILSGVYTGEPDAHTMQLLYPLAWVLRLFYQAADGPVFGLFLFVCQAASIWAVAFRALGFLRTLSGKALALGVLAAFWWGAFGGHLVFLQYTVTAGMLCGAAIFWVVTGQPESSPGKFLLGNLPALLFYWTGFCLRSEMGLLLLPLAGVAGWCAWRRGARENGRFFGRACLLRYPALAFVLAVGLAACLFGDSMGYRTEEWRTFRHFFDDRTELYDYHLDVINDYEGNRQIYQRAGISREQQELLRTYNFGADDSLDGAAFSSLREALEDSGNGVFFKITLRQALWSLGMRHMLGGRDAPFNFLFLLLLLFLVLIALIGRRHGLWWDLLGVSAVSGALWMFLLLRDRLEDRVFHPLYLAQILLLTGFLFLEIAGKKGEEGASAGERPERRRGRSGSFALLIALSVFLLCIARLPAMDRKVSAEAGRRALQEELEGEVFAYCGEHPGTLFLADVYSTTDDSESIWRDRDKPFNLDLLGGWMVKSPLTAQKLSAFGYSTMEEALLSGEARILAKEDADLRWLSDWTGSHGLRAAVSEDRIGDAVRVIAIRP